MSLADTMTLLSHNVVLPPGVVEATEKLQAWSLMVDVFHGPNHAISVAIRGLVKSAIPCLNRLHSMYTGEPAQIQDYCCRLLFDAQQDYFHWCTRTANGAAVAVPTFDKITMAISTDRFENLCSVPLTWNHLLLKNKKRYRLNR